MAKTPKCPIFIFGYPRSGTTLLWALLNAHSKIRLVLEPELVRGMLLAGLRFSKRSNHKEHAKSLEKMKKIGATNQHLSSLPDEIISDFVNCRKNLSFKEIYETLLPIPENSEIWGAKSLGNSFYIPKLYQLYPNAAFFHIVRDPRAVLLSHYRKKFAGSKPCTPEFGMKEVRFFAQSALLWKRWLWAVKKSRQNLKNATIIQIRFKDLINHLEKNLRQICTAIGVDFEPKMLETSSRKSKLKSEWEYAHQNLSQPIDTNRAKASRELPEWACYIVEKYAAKEMKELGYSLSEKQCSYAEKIRIESQLLIYNKKIHKDVDEKIARRKPFYHLAAQ